MEKIEELVRFLVSRESTLVDVVTKLINRESVISERLDKVLDDHEKRIRLIERFIGFGLGAIGFGSLLVQILFRK